MRRWFVLAWLTVSCVTSPPPSPYFGPRPPAPPGDAYAQLAASPLDITQIGHLDDRMIDFRYDGGQLEFDMYRLGHRVVLSARNRYAVPIMVAWSIGTLENLRPVGETSGVVLVPPASRSLGSGPLVILTELEQLDSTQPYSRTLTFKARFGDPDVVPIRYDYGLPYPRGQTFAVLQGFHGAFSHRGSNEFAVDFDCPVATPVLASRPGTVVAANATAQGSGTTPDFLDYKRTNFVMVMHEDGTIGEYMHLAPATVEVKPGQHVERGQELALSGNTGFSSTPHLHFQVMTAAPDGVSAQSFPFEMAVAPGKVEEPTLSRRYTGWEPRAVDAPVR
ncbi:peptidoglycan DD-metalloendopeptidase family protein [soil metagenome]